MARKTRHGHTIDITNENLTIYGIKIPPNSRCEGLPEYERSNRREELLLAIAVALAEEYGFSVCFDDGAVLSIGEVLSKE